MTIDLLRHMDEAQQRVHGGGTAAGLSVIYVADAADKTVSRGRNMAIPRLSADAAPGDRRRSLTGLL